MWTILTAAELVRRSESCSSVGQVTKLQEGKKRLRTSVRAYRAQMDAGSYFLREHPKGARSWEEPVIKELRDDPRVYEVVGPMRRWKMESEDVWGEERNQVANKLAALGEDAIWRMLQ